MKRLCSLIFILISLHLNGQELHIEKTRFIGGDSCHTAALNAISTLDNGVVFMGYTYCNGVGDIPPTQSYQQNSNFMIGKMNSSTQIEWVKLYGGSQADDAIAGCRTYDGGYAFIGITESNNGDVSGFQGGRDLWLVKTDSQGNLLWQKTFGSSFDDKGLSIAETENHDLIILGCSNGSGGDIPTHYGGQFSFDWIVVKTDSVGNKKWCKVYGGTGDEDTQGTILAVGQDYFIAGGSESTDIDCYDTSWFGTANTAYNFHLLKLDTAGTLAWDKSYGGSQGEGVRQAIFDERDSTIVMTGFTNSTNYSVSDNPGYWCEWVVKVDLSGTLNWARSLYQSGTQHSSGGSIAATDSGYYVSYNVTATTASIPGVLNPHVFLLDTLGNTISHKIWGSTQYDNAWSLVASGSRLIAVGSTSIPQFTEGSNFGQLGTGQKAFFSYVDFWPLSVLQTSSGTISIHLYPNPARNSFTLVCPSSGSTGSVTVSNSEGKVLYKKRVQNGRHIIETEGWKRGIYSVQWKGDDRLIATGKIVLN